MKSSWIRAWFIASVALMVTLGACAPKNATAGGTAAPAGGEGEAAVAGLPDRDPQLAHRLVEEQEALLLDVRSQSEFDAGHAEGAVLVPHTEVAERIAEIEELQDGEKDKPIVVYCGSGRRAAVAKQSLVDAGFTQVTNVGGLDDYQSVD